MFSDTRLPVPGTPFGPLSELALAVFNLTSKSRSEEALRLADKVEPIAATLGDERTVCMIRLARMYALQSLDRAGEALDIGDSLVAPLTAFGPRASEAKILADTAETLIRLGRIDEGLHRLARATALLETAPRGTNRYISAVSSACEAAYLAELYELADEFSRQGEAWYQNQEQPGTRLVGVTTEANGDATFYLQIWQVQRAELLLEWGLRLQQIGRYGEAGSRFAKSIALTRRWAQEGRGHPLAAAVLALGLAKTDQADEALSLVHAILAPLREAGQLHEAALIHLAHGVALRTTGKLRTARRELIAAAELARRSSLHLILQYELAELAARESPGQATRVMLAALQEHLQYLWRLRLDRRMMLRQARRRAELEVAQAQSDRAAESDALTGLGNRRLFDRYLDSVERGVALLLVDIDQFKDVNDTFSHGVGDRVLREVAAILRAHCRHGDVAIRFGGDEFAMFLHADLPAAITIAERIRQVIAARDWSQLAPGLRVTVSMGIAVTDDGAERDLFDQADHQLYTAKRAGRDRLAA